eukprot:gene37116-45054_t
MEPASSVSSKKLSNCWKVALFLAIFVALVAAYLGLCFQRKSWYTVPPMSPAQFQSTNFTVRDIPTTYYRVGELGKVLNGWYNPYKDPSHDKSMEGYIHLFRPAPDSPPFTFDVSKVTAMTQVDFFMDTCSYPDSILCKTCAIPKGDVYDIKSAVVNVSEIMARPSTMYSCFAKLDDIGSVRTLLDAVNIPNLDLTKVNIEHAFIANFDRDRLTAYIHGATVQSSMAVQFVGSKRWLFFSPRVLKDPDMLHAFAAAGISVPTKGPDGAFDVYPYESQPGDILFFSENWAHAVNTLAGPNFMMTFRRLEMGNILRRPVEWLQAVFNAVLMENKKRLGRQRTPYNELLKIYLKKLDPLCEDGTVTPFDQVMVDLIRKTSKSV